MVEGDAELIVGLSICDSRSNKKAERMAFLSMQAMFCCFACLLASWSLSEAILCKGSAKYKLIFKGEWTRTSHPEDFPARNSPHFSRVVGCSHNSSYVMWKPGMNATLGVKDVAERGK